MTAQIKLQTLIVEINMNIRRALIKVILTLIFLYGLYLVWAVIAFGGGCRNKVPETHILPFGYTGKVYIIFNQEDGLPKEYCQNGSRLYRIPKSGILKSKFKSNYGWIDASEKINFYYRMHDSLILLNKLIAEEELNENLDSNRIVVFEYGNVAQLNFEFEGDILTYIVDSLKNFDKRDYRLTQKEFDQWNK